MGDWDLMVLLTMGLVLAVLFIVPFLVYAAGNAAGVIKAPTGISPAAFLTSVFLSKVGTAIAFVLLFRLAQESVGGQWLLFALPWWIMFVVGEIGYACGPNYSWQEAVAGILSETIYVPLAAFLAHWLLG